MADVSLDNPGEVHWFSGEGPKPIVGTCNHDCLHMGTSVIAWGPDFDHYELVECDKCKCRAWFADYPASAAQLSKRGKFVRIVLDG
jgi:hypothetical protein